MMNTLARIYKIIHFEVQHELGYLNMHIQKMSSTMLTCNVKSIIVSPVMVSIPCFEKVYFYMRNQSAVFVKLVS